MRKIFFISLALLVLGLAVYGYFKSIPQAENEDALPKIEISPKSFNFGEIKYGEIVNYTFKVKNVGQGILDIKRVATSCACTRAKITKEKLAPGEEADLLVRYDSGAMSGPHGRGKQERIIYIKSSDPINPQVEATIKAYVKPR